MLHVKLQFLFEWKGCSSCSDCNTHSKKNAVTNNEFIIVIIYFFVKMNPKEQVGLEVKKMGLIGVTNEISILTRF